MLEKDIEISKYRMKHALEDYKTAEMDLQGEFYKAAIKNK